MTDIPITGQIADAVYMALVEIGANPGRSSKLGMYAAIKKAVEYVVDREIDKLVKHSPKYTIDEIEQAGEHFHVAAADLPLFPESCAIASADGHA